MTGPGSPAPSSPSGPRRGDPPVYLLVLDHEGYEARSGRYQVVEAHHDVSTALARVDDLRRAGAPWWDVELMTVPAVP